MGGGRGYRPDIDGLRAVAVGGVVAYHAFPWAVPGGYVGVDVFFVISGFLITAILMQEASSGGIDPVGFYRRRVLRIFPALIVVLVTALVGGLLLLPDSEIPSLGLDLFGASTFSANLVLFSEVGYFEVDAERKPLLHLWSLGVEEQFYLVWPLVLWGLAKIRRFAFFGLVVAGAASFIAAWATITDWADLNFYMPFLRGWELIAGAVIAAAWSPAFRPPDRLCRLAERTATAVRLPLADIVSLAGVAAIAAAMAIYDAETRFPGPAAALPVVGAALLIAAPGGIVGRWLLSHPIAVFIGKVSYPWYLWHWPVFAFVRVALEAEAQALATALAVPLTFAAAVATWWFVERPLRFGGRAALRAAVLSLIVFVLAVVGVLVHRLGATAVQLPAELAGLAGTKRDFTAEWRQGTCFLVDAQASQHFADECTGTGSGPRVVIWGDSHATALHPGLKAVAAEKGGDLALSLYTVSNCPPHLGRDMGGRPQCRRLNDEAMARIVAERPDVVILSSRWRRVDTSTHMFDTARALERAGVKRVVLIGPTPRWQGRLPDLVVDYFRKGRGVMPRRARFGLSGFAADEEAKAGARGVPATFVSIFDVFCDRDGCLTRTSDDFADLTTWDYGHLSPVGAAHLMREIWPRISDGSPASR